MRHALSRCHYRPWLSSWSSAAGCRLHIALQSYFLNIQRGRKLSRESIACPGSGGQADTASMLLLHTTAAGCSALTGRNSKAWYESISPVRCRYPLSQHQITPRLPHDCSVAIPPVGTLAHASKQRLVDQDEMQLSIQTIS